MNSVQEVKLCIENLLIPFADCICWEDFGEKGGPCYNPNKFTNSNEEESVAFTMALVRLAMPKGGNSHLLLAKKVAKILGNQYIWYDWLNKSVGRLLSGTNYMELKGVVSLADNIRKRI